MVDSVLDASWPGQQPANARGLTGQEAKKSDGQGSEKKASWLHRDHLTLAEYAELDAILAEFGRNLAGLEAAAEIMQIPLARLAAVAGRNPELMRQPIVTVGGEAYPPDGAA